MSEYCNIPSTPLPSPSNKELSPSFMVMKWLHDERRVALSTWDTKLVKEIGYSKYRYRSQLITLQLVTMTLTPSVDVDMWTDQSVFI